MQFRFPNVKKSAEPRQFGHQLSEPPRLQGTFREQVIFNVSKCLRETGRGDQGLTVLHN
jgi:hypothetical protein